MKTILSVMIMAISLSLNGQDFNVIKELLNQDKVFEASDIAQQIVQRNPDLAAAHYWLGASMYRSYVSSDLNPNKEIKSIIDAGIAFEKAEYLDPSCSKKADHGQALKAYGGKAFNLGVLSYQKKEMDIAFTFFKMSNQVSEWTGKPDSESMYYAGHCANKLGDHKSAKDFLGKLVSKEPSNEKAVKELAQAHLNLEELDEMKSLLQSSLVHNPNSSDLWYEFMNVTSMLNLPEESLEAAQTLSHLESGNTENLAFLASLYDKTGEKEKAITTYTNCLSIDGDHQKANYNLGVLYYNEAVTVSNIATTDAQKNDVKENLIKAEKYLTQAQNLDSQNVELEMLLSNIQNMK